eukprot:TRINITY_DN16945_c0_g1_i3.p1 TRINITY_DN16945_c0_g1~~TRINITY_DN16945_c0_g1_i3.p1  ORF type:complete len:131 (+),score=13.32 TRINITY_DN16945_c0_g1_i3:269-661(+)
MRWERGVVWGGSAAELVAYLLGRYSEMLKITPYLDGLVAMPSIGVTLASGAALTWLKFGSKGKPIPTRIRVSILLMLLLTIIWAVADRSTQHAKRPEDVFVVRCSVNLLESVLVCAMQLLMKDDTRRDMT